MSRFAGLVEVQQAATDAGALLDLYPASGGKVWTLSKIVIPKSARSSGAGTSVMKAVVREADAEGVVVALTPSTDFGASSKARLVDFYKRFGFVENKGKNKDFSISEAMYRPPRVRQLGALSKTGRIPMTLKSVPKFPGFKFKLKRTRQYGEYLHHLSVFDASGKLVAEMEVGHCYGGEWAQIRDADISTSMRSRGLYPAMLTKMRDFVKRKGCWGLVSSNRVGDLSTKSWEKFAKREPRVKKEGDEFFFSGLPKTGRIPMTTVRRAMKKLGRKAAACGITPASLRLGMEVEREHRDVTKGGVLKTAKIAAAHLCESPRYYTELKKLENRLKRRK